jgi:hypothetical protein
LQRLVTLGFALGKLTQRLVTLGFALGKLTLQIGYEPLRIA